MAAAQIPGWTGADGQASQDWNSCLLGGCVIPGIVTVEGLKVGVEVDTKKAKGSDQPTSTDNGVDAAKFSIHVWMNESHWPAWQEILPTINPRRPGRERQPLQIITPITVEFGITTVRVISIEGGSPTARGGMRRVIHVEEWFDRPKAKPKKKEVPVQAISPTLGQPILVNDRYLETIPELDPTVHELTQEEARKLSTLTPEERVAQVTRALAPKKAPDSRANILENLFGP